ncbi:MAG: hypothetical protein P8N43_05010 [Alphaproteobacteria bacterium]|jgi:hypothetical protein|nr:hypothetical protein [Alphaproteobacteria bacterium]
MAKRFAYYYLQLNSGDVWDTLEQSENVAVLNAGLADQLASPTDAEIRIVGANLDEQSGQWSYEQLFYIDQSSIDLGISEDDYDDGAAFDEPEVAPVEVPDEPAPMEASEPGPAVAALLQERGDLDRSDPDPVPVEDEVAAPWLRSRDDDEGAGLEGPEPFQFDTTPPRRRVSIGKIIGFVFVFLFLTVWVAIGALVYLQHPLLMDTADKLGIGEYLRLSSDTDGSETPSSHSTAESESVAQVQPPTSGQVVRYVGIAPALRGRWSPRKCDSTFIEFGEDGYKRSIDGQEAAGETEISETLEDDFVFYLRRSADMVEHYRKVTANDIQLAGATTESGFLGSSEKVAIYSRCP